MSDQQAAFESREGGVLAMSGPLTFASVAAAWREGKARILAARPTVLDLAAVQRADSAGLACVLALLACGRELQPQLAIRNAPDSLRDLARVSDAEKWLLP
ncbi:MAG: STAS domain-containing protein [Rhodanobacteraceae bacterium]